MLANPFRRFNPVQHWHSDIEKNDVWVEFCRSLDCLDSIARLADHLPLRTRLQHGSHTHSPLGKIVGDQNTEGIVSFHTLSL